MIITIVAILLGTGCLIFGGYATYSNIFLQIGSLQVSAGIIFIIVGLTLILFCLKRPDTLDGIVKVEVVKGWHLFFVGVSILILGVLAGFFVNSLIAVNVEAPKPYDVFKDVLFATLTILSLFVAILGTLVFYYIKTRLESDTQATIDKETSIMFARTFTALSYFHWFHNELESAITNVETAYNYFEKFIDEDDLKHIKLLCIIRNNWAYFLADRGLDQDREFALKCAEFLKNNLVKFPDHVPSWQDTINHIEEVYSSTEEES